MQTITAARARAADHGARACATDAVALDELARARAFDDAVAAGHVQMIDGMCCYVGPRA